MIPERFAPATYALFRIITGFVFFIDGTQKVFGWPGAQAVTNFMTMQGAAGIIELVAGFLIMIGLFTKPAAFIASGEMAVAFFYIHVNMLAKVALPLGVIPQLNMGERAAVFAVAFLYIAARGAGILSVDGARRGGRR
jgi:putative oxidoreductase